jgi:hypothetical protein
MVVSIGARHRLRGSLVASKPQLTAGSIGARHQYKPVQTGKWLAKVVVSLGARHRLRGSLVASKPYLPTDSIGARHQYKPENG